MITSIVLGAALVCALGTMLVSAFRTWTSDRARTLRVLRSMRWWMAALVPLDLAVVTAVALCLLQIPGLDIGYWRLLTGQNGNALLGQTNSTNPFLHAAAYVLPLVVALAVPREALAEEHLFRNGLQKFSAAKQVGLTLLFGLMHVIVGVPIGIGLALAVMGAFYYLVYRIARRKHLPALVEEWGEWSAGEHLAGLLADEAATFSAAAAHTLNNWLVLCVLFGYLISAL